MSRFFGSQTSANVHDSFISPLLSAVSKAEAKRRCIKLPDELWLELGTRRTLSDQKSGRGFLEGMEDRLDVHLNFQTFFESLTSERRLRFLESVSGHVCQQVDDECLDENDPFLSVKSLSNYEIFAGDGHYVDHACHDKRIEDKHYASGDFFAANLRTHSLFHLSSALRDGTRKREHDMHALKSLTVESLRNGAVAGRQVLWIWDRAGIDAQFWAKVRSTHGIYFLSRAKENMRLDTLGPLPYNETSPCNRGVTRFELVSVANTALRCVYYTCPDSGHEFIFLTTLTTIEPGIIAMLYKARWDIEKIFDELKRKLEESKSWASSPQAKRIHALFRCLAHNLLLIHERWLSLQHGITDQKDLTRARKRLHESILQARERGALLSPLAKLLALRRTQRPLCFIRWVRNSIDKCASWEALLRPLRARLGCF